MTQAGRPALRSSPGDEGCLTGDGRETAGDAIDRRALQGRPRHRWIVNGETVEPDGVLISPDSKHVYTRATACSRTGTR